MKVWEAVKTKSVSVSVLGADRGQGAVIWRAVDRKSWRFTVILVDPMVVHYWPSPQFSRTETPNPHCSATTRLYLKLTGSEPLREEWCLLRNWLHISFSLHISCSGHGACAHVFLAQTEEERGGKSHKEKSCKVGEFFEKQALFEVPPLFFKFQFVYSKQ